MTKLRFPIACLLAGVITVALFGFLRELTDTRVAAEAALAAPKMEFVRLRREVEIEEKKREKPEREKPEQKPMTPTLAVASKEGVDLGLDVQAIASGLGASTARRAAAATGRARRSAPGSRTATRCRWCASSRSTHRRRASAASRAGSR